MSVDQNIAGDAWDMRYIISCINIVDYWPIPAWYKLKDVGQVNNTITLLQVK